MSDCPRCRKPAVPGQEMLCEHPFCPLPLPASQGTANWTMPMPSGEPGSYLAPASPSPGLRESNAQADAEWEKRGIEANPRLREGSATINAGKGHAAGLPPYDPFHAWIDSNEAAGLREAVIEDVLAEFEKRTKAVPVGHEIPSRGSSTYNWRRCHLDELRQIAASLSRPVSEREGEQ